MATVVETYKREDGHEIAVYESGAQYDLTAGKLVGGPPQTQFNRETSVLAVERRLELKREAVARGAAKVLESSGDWDAPITDMDVVEAVSEAVMLKALNPKDAKQVDAARYLESGMGLSESQPSSTAGVSNQAVTALGTELARQFMQIVADVLKVQQDPVRPADVINVDATDIRNE
jgi:methylaspartate ammonia-lyase